MYGNEPQRPLSERSLPFSLKTEHSPKSEILMFPGETAPDSAWVGRSEHTWAHTLGVEQQVLGLEVPMSDAFRMDELLPK